MSKVLNNRMKSSFGKNQRSDSGKQNRFAKNDNRFSKDNRRTENRFNRDNSRFGRDENRFKKNDTRFDRDENRFKKNDGRFARDENRFGKKDASFSDRKNRQERHFDKPFHKERKTFDRSFEHKKEDMPIVSAFPSGEYTVTESEENMRLDRWFKRQFPSLTHGMLEKMLRRKAVRLNHLKAGADSRLSVGDILSFPDLTDYQTKQKQGYRLSDREEAFARSLVIYKDDEVIALNKPAGLAVQGGSKQKEYLEKYLDALRFEKKERPVLVHRLDKDTSGVLLLARSRKAAEVLGNDFKNKAVFKVYLALVEGEMPDSMGEISAPLMKKGFADGEKMVVDEENGQKAWSTYQVLENLKEVSLVALSPKTGRTHQLRVHCSFVGNPILGDVKYGSSYHMPLQLHAWQVTFKKVFARTKKITVVADMPTSMIKNFKQFGIDKPEMTDVSETL